MKRALTSVIVLCCLAGWLSAADGPAPAPLYSLPADGSWIEYDWDGLTSGGDKQSGTLRVSSVGTIDVKGQPHRWVEVKLVTKNGDQSRVKIRKLLIDEKIFQKGGSLREGVVEVLALDDGRRVMKLTPGQADLFFGLGFTPESASLDRKEKQGVEVGLGKFQTIRLTAQGKRGETTLRYEGALTDEVPFGWAKFEVHESKKDTSRRVFTASAARKGTGARSEVPAVASP